MVVEGIMGTWGVAAAGETEEGRNIAALNETSPSWHPPAALGLATCSYYISSMQSLWND
jgi:hypothetical protein